MGTMVLVGILLDPEELLGRVYGDSFLKDGIDFINSFLLELVMVLPFPFGMIGGVSRVLYEFFSPSLCACREYRCKYSRLLSEWAWWCCVVSSFHSGRFCGGLYYDFFLQ